MAGYPGQRPYGGGPPAPRPGPGPGPAPAQRGPPQQYDNFQQDGYGYDYYDDGGYDQNYGGQYQDPNYGRGPPPNQGYPPQGMYPPNPMPPPPQQQQQQLPPPQNAGYGGPGEFGGDQDGYRDTRASFGDVYDAYYQPSRMSNQSAHSYGHHDAPEYNGAPSHAPRGSFEQHMRPGIAEHTQPGAKRVPEMSRTKSQPDLRQSQQAVFEMAGDAPPMPPMGNGYQDAYNQPNGWDQPQNPQMGRPGLPQGPSPNRGPDSLPSHPAPVRPGHMPNSMVVKSTPNDQETAMRLAKRLVEAADVLAPNLADPKMKTRARERYLADANKILKKLSSAQNSEAMFFYADCLGRGLFGLEPDNKEAFTLYQSAAKLGHAAAAYRTAVCCEIGHEEGGGTRKDPLKAIQWYKRAATLGDTPAMYKVGMILLKGLLGQPKNPREAVGWLKRAAERADAENPHALHELGLLYESAAPNDAIIKDEAYAFQLFREAADLGYKFSQYRLGCAFEYGLMGCPVDPRQSIMWYSRAAQQGEHQSELSLSGWYLTGTDNVLQQSDTEAYLWARKAATAGLAKAEYAMGYFTEVGIGVPANMEDAKRWYWRAAAQDFPKARERLEDLKRAGKNGPRQRERISRSKIGKQQEGECSVM
ncbi:uncharacterized protein BDZ83DRAFT_422079 [Colletotrichum acutatum]|uniref:Chitin synthase activator n=1 Tax=Glomerella acutata TaxID=27357 RepID=A0AAD8XMA4_GLOAC|nr:uncharacterized protein BDZ83DRAFT_422079 [Colletotrichum acutatum]KAK1730052.1 hypothetical protein BDZ83DRAFT_422079 [Colletotrichum acutatum]